MKRSSKALERVLIAGGGTGGHLFPGVAVAEELQERGVELRFVGTERGIEARVIPSLGWTLDTIDVTGLKGKGGLRLLRSFSNLPHAWRQSREIIKNFRPQVVVGVGGYASGPIVATAASMRIPTAVLEQNSVPGMTNRILGKVVKEVYGSFPDPEGFFPKKKFRLIGNPVRRGLIETVKKGRESGPRSDGELHLLVVGGSQGARAINEMMLESAGPLLNEFPNLKIRHQCGRAEHKKVLAAYQETKDLDIQRVDCQPFYDEMAVQYGWADLVVGRAGATTLAELAICACPAILIPYPFAADDHQRKNAEVLVKSGAAEMGLESEVDGRWLGQQIAELLRQPKQRLAMQEAMSGHAKPRAAQDICDALREIVG